MRFSIQAWAACAPELSDRTSWETWAKRPHLPQGQASPPLDDMPAMLRRRLEPLGRMALRAAYDCQPGTSGQVPAIPIIFASRHGDAARAYTLLHELARNVPLSPTDFSLSVHNAVAALYSIARQDRSPYTALAAGPVGAEAALIEAMGLLAEGVPEVLVVVYDTPLPPAWSPFADGPECAFAWAWRVAACDAKAAGYSLETLACSPAAGPAAGALPHSLDVLRFFLSGEASLKYMHRGCLWCWQRHA